MTRLPAIAHDLGTHHGFAHTENGIHALSGVKHFDAAKNQPSVHRLWQFDRWLRQLYKQVQPEIIYVEKVSFQQKGHAAGVYFKFLGVLELVAFEMRNIPLVYLPVGTIKLAATGKGNAGKDRMMQAARERWSHTRVTSHDQADALMILHAGLLHAKGAIKMPEKASKPRRKAKTEPKQATLL